MKLVTFQDIAAGARIRHHDHGDMPEAYIALDSAQHLYAAHLRQAKIQHDQVWQPLTPVIALLRQHGQGHFPGRSDRQIGLDARFPEGVGRQQRIAAVIVNQQYFRRPSLTYELFIHAFKTRSFGWVWTTGRPAYRRSVSSLILRVASPGSQTNGNTTQNH